MLLRSVVVNEVVVTKNSISSNSGWRRILKTLAVPTGQNGAGFIAGIASGHQRWLSFGQLDRGHPCLVRLC